MFYRSKTRPQPPACSTEARQDHSPQNMFYRSKTGPTTVPRTCSTGASPDDSSQNMFYRRQDHSPKSTFYSSAPHQRSQKAAVAPWSNATRTAVGQHGRPYVRIICKRSESAHEQRIVLYKSNQQQQPSEDAHSSSKPPAWPSEAEPCLDIAEEGEKNSENWFKEAQKIWFLGKKTQCTWVQKVYRAQRVYIYIQSTHTQEKSLYILYTACRSPRG